jgi:transcriptional regulator with XRE-family HTH domain
MACIHFSLLGRQVKLGRKQRKWSERNLAERVGISRTTLQKFERGEMTCAIGLVFEVATRVGIFANNEYFRCGIRPSMFTAIYGVVGYSSSSC